MAEESTFVPESANSDGRAVRCKIYHDSKGIADPGEQRGLAMNRKSRCPSWAASPKLRQKLLDEALPDPDGGKDRMGRPKRLWNAIASWTFVAVSTGETLPGYNCYPDVPATVLLPELSERAQRSLEEFAEEESATDESSSEKGPTLPALDEGQ